MRSVFIRLAALSLGVAIVASCDSRVPTSATVGGSNPGGGSNPNTGGSGTLTIGIDSPLAGALINRGDSVLVTIRLRSNQTLKNAIISGVTEKGSVDLGTYVQRLRYKSITVPATGTFRQGLRDTTIRRYLQPADADTTLDSLRVLVTANDSSGTSATASKVINIVAGPAVNIVSPSANDSVPAGVGLNVAARATHPSGVSRIDIRVKGDVNWPTKLDTTLSQTYQTNPRDVTFSTVVVIPVNAPLRGRITITANAVDVDRQPGSAQPVAAFVRAAAAATPRVTQTVPLKTEYTDSVSVRATGEAITAVGLIIRDSTGSIVHRDTVRLSPPYAANVQATIPLGLEPNMQGKKLRVASFATDQAGRIGYSVPVTRATSETDLNAAQWDSTLVVHGRTYALPQQGVIADIAVDATRGNVFLSNTAHNLLNVWQSSAANKGFASTSIPVGSLPWGLAISNNPDTLLVANSGGTNISRVFIGSTTASSLHEDLANRILTRNSYVFRITVQRDETTGKVKLTAAGPFSYSDRPQFIAQSKGGRIFFSTRPTAAAPAGTIRWLDPNLPVPDGRQVWQYANRIESTEQVYALFNVDSIAIGAALPNSTASDTLFIWDHPYGQATGDIAVMDTIPLNAVAQAVAGGSDAEMVLRLDINSLPLTDTTFAAVSGDRTWIAFGEGHKTGAARVIMVGDSAGPVPNFFSPLVTIADLTENASEQVFGLALDRNGATVASHGSQSFFSAVNAPFHLRLQGKYDSFDEGSGITFHPAAQGSLTPMSERLAFVGAASGQVEIVDIAYYINRGRLQLKYPIYGPLRASGPMPGDPADVVLKLYAVGQKGLVVIDLTAADIKAGPP